MTSSHLSANLRYLCGFYPSISEVCRCLGFNRQQFNKYLSGQVRPSPYNLRRLCEFFAVSEADLHLPPARFAEVVGAAHASVAADTGTVPALRAFRELSEKSRGALERYRGYYFRYFHSFGYPGYIIKSLAAITEREGHYFWKNVEVIATPRRPARRTVMKYHGVALCLGDRIYIMEYEALLKSSVTQLILYRSYENPISYMTGVQTGAPTVRGRKPTASTVLLEYLGEEIDLRAALGACGLFAADSETIPEQVRERVRNVLGPQGHVLEAEEV